MVNCEFCNTSFNPRPQIKRPRACPKKECQRLRQRSNEKEWRKRHMHLYDSRYHQIRRVQRQTRLKDISERIHKCIEVGKTFLGFEVDLKQLHLLFENFVFSLGIRSVNKFWRDVST